MAKQTPTDAELKLILEAAEEKPIKRNAPTYGRPTRDLDVPRSIGNFETYRPLSVADLTWFSPVPFDRIKADPAGPGGALDVLAMTQVRGAEAQPPITPRSAPVKGSVENP